MDSLIAGQMEQSRRLSAGRVDGTLARYGLRPAKNGHYNQLVASGSSTHGSGSESAFSSRLIASSGRKLADKSNPTQLSSSKSTTTMGGQPIARILTGSCMSDGGQWDSVNPVPVQKLYSIAEQEEEDTWLVSSTLNGSARPNNNNNSNSQRRRRDLTTAALYLATLSLLSTLTCTYQQQVYDNRYRMGGTGNDVLALNRAPQMRPTNQAEDPYATAQRYAPTGRGPSSQAAQVWASRALVSEYRDGRGMPEDREPSAQLIVRRTTASTNNSGNNNKPSQNVMKSVRHIVTTAARSSGGNTSTVSTSGLYGDMGGDTLPPDNPIASSLEVPPDASQQADVCSDRLCYGLPEGCLVGLRGSSLLLDPVATPALNSSDPSQAGSSMCKAMVTAKRFIDPSRPVSRDILFELIGLPEPGYDGNYVAVGFSETGRMTGFVTECVQYRDPKSSMQMIDLRHSFNVPTYRNVPVEIISGIKKLGVTFEGGYYQCRWIVESAVEFSYSDPDSNELLTRREDLGYKSYHVLLASGEYDTTNGAKRVHTHRVSSIAPLSLAQTGHIKSLGPHILIRIHGSLMIVIWIGFTTLSIILARYYKNEWSNLKISDSALWFVVHRSLMLATWFGTLIAIIFAFMYTETYHPGIHQISGTTCLVLTSLQVLAGLLRPSLESSKRVYFNWIHFVMGNLSYLCAMISLITAAFLAPAQLPPLYIWIMVLFVATYALTHITMTLHQYIVHKSSSKLSMIDEMWLQTFIRPPLTPLENSYPTRKEISITPVNESSNSSANGKNHNNNKLTSNGHIAELSYPKESSSPFRQFIMGILVTVIVIFIVLLISLVNIK